MKLARVNDVNTVMYSPVWVSLGQFGSKITNAKNMQKTIVQEQQRCSVQKAAPKNTKYWRNETTLKIGHHAKAIAHAKSSLWLKN